MIGIIGSGNLGANAAFFAAERNIGDVVLYDTKEGVPIGKALDMMEAAPVRGYRFALRGTNAMDDALAGDVVIIAAGAVRAPGATRGSLLGANRPIVDELAMKLREFGGVVIVVTEPVDLMVAAIVKASGLPSQRVIGIGAALDAVRLRFAVARELSVSAEDVTATVVGRHDDDMVIPAAYTSVSGVPVRQLIDEKRWAQIVSEVRKAGDTIVELAQRSSSYYGPAAVAAELAQAVVDDSRRHFSVSFVLRGQLGITGVALSFPAVIGRGGIVRVLEPKLSAGESKALKASAAALASAGGAR